MFFGSYNSEINKKGQFEIPEEYRRVLRLGEQDKQGLFFVAANKLRVYSHSSSSEFTDQLYGRRNDRNRKEADALLRYTIQNGPAYYSENGLATIPDTFMKRFNLYPGKIVLMGIGDYFEINKAEAENTEM